MKIVTFLDLLGATMCVFLAVRLLVQAVENRTAAQAFAAFLGCCGLLMIDDAFYREGWFAHFPWMYAVANPFIAAISPCFYLYTRAAVDPAFRWRPRTFGHLVVPALLLLAEMPTFLLPSEAKVASAALDFNPDYRTGRVLDLLLLDSYFLGYVGVAWWKLWKERVRILEKQEEGRSHPLRGIGLFATLFLVVGLLTAVLDFTKWSQSGSSIAVLSIVLLAFGLLWSATHPHTIVIPAWPDAAGSNRSSEQALVETAAARGLNPSALLDPLACGSAVAPFSDGRPQVEIDAENRSSVEASGDRATTQHDTAGTRLADEAKADSSDAAATSADPMLASLPPLPGSAPVDEPVDEPRSKSGLKPGEAERIAARLRRLLETDRVFLDPDLSLQTLAEKARTTRHRLSAVLGQVFATTFFQVIAAYRVQEAARLLRSDRGAVRTIADIAFASGFNTLSAFNAAFRAHFNTTPSAYRATSAAGGQKDGAGSTD